MQPVARWFYIVVSILLAWNLIGLFAVYSDVTMTAEQIATLPEAMQKVYYSRPMWSVAASCVAVMAGTLGSVALLIRLKWAMPLLLASLAGIVVQDISFALNEHARALIDGAALVLQGLVLLCALYLVWLCRLATQRQWLRQ